MLAHCAYRGVLDVCIEKIWGEGVVVTRFGPQVSPSPPLGLMFFFVITVVGSGCLKDFFQLNRACNSRF